MSTRKPQAPYVESLLDTTLEEAFLGALLIDPDGLLSVRSVVRPDDLIPRHALLYETLAEMYDARKAIDFLTVCDALKQKGKLEEAGGAANISDLINAVPSAVHLPTYAEAVRRLGILRAFVILAQYVVKKAYEPGMKPDALYAWIDEELQKIRLRQRDLDVGTLRGENFLPWYETLIFERQEQRRTNTLRIFDWPWASWNKRIRPMREGTLGVIVAPDGSGKSIALEMIAEHWARRGHKVLLIHLEDETSVKADRRLARWTGIPLEVLESGALTPEQTELWQKTETAIAEAWGPNLTYKHAPGYTAGEVIAFAEADNALGRCDVAVIDYLNKLDADAEIIYRTKDDWRRDAIIVERLRNFGERTRMPILTAAQMNKAGKDDWRNSTRNSARGTGELADKAQLIVTFGRELAGPEGIYASNGQQIAAEGEYSPLLNVRVDKQNMGRTGGLAAQWLDGPRFRIFDLVQGAK